MTVKLTFFESKTKVYDIESEFLNMDWIGPEYTKRL